MDSRIKQLITFQVRSGQTEEQVCNDIGITRKTLNNLKNNKTKPQSATIELIDKYLNNQTKIR